MRPDNVPEKFWDAEKGAVKTEDVLKSYTELEKSIGKPKYDIPASDAAPEVLADYYKKMGVPDAPEGYALEAPAEYPEHMGEYMKDTLGEFAKVAHDAKMTPAQAKAVQGWFDNMAIGLGKSAEDAQAQAIADGNTKLNDLFTQSFGERAAAVSAEAGEIMQKAVPEDIRKALGDQTPEETLQIVALVHQYMKKEYGLSDNNLDDQGLPTGKTLEDVRKESQTLMASDAYRDPMHKDHAATVQKVNADYKTIAALTNAAKKK